jgi:hypothetical protein
MGSTEVERAVLQASTETHEDLLKLLLQHYDEHVDEHVASAAQGRGDPSPPMGPKAATAQVNEPIPDVEAEDLDEVWDDERMPPIAGVVAALLMPHEPTSVPERPADAAAGPLRFAPSPGASAVARAALTLARADLLTLAEAQEWISFMDSGLAATASAVIDAAIHDCDH